MQIDLKKYTEFVNAITSKDSNDHGSFINRINTLSIEHPSLNIPLLITSAMGMSGEAGEFSEIVKKCIFHSKDFTEETRTHLKKELGDQVWYWTNACRALNLDPNQVIADNVTKLEARYPGGHFNAASSANRADGDI